MFTGRGKSWGTGVFAGRDTGVFTGRGNHGAQGSLQVGTQECLQVGGNHGAQESLQVGGNHGAQGPVQAGTKHRAQWPMQAGRKHRAQGAGGPTQMRPADLCRSWEPNGIPCCLHQTRRSTDRSVGMLCVASLTHSTAFSTHFTHPLALAQWRSAGYDPAREESSDRHGDICSVSVCVWPSLAHTHGIGTMSNSWA